MKIEKGIPIPPIRNQEIVKALNEMEVGDSIFTSILKDKNRIRTQLNTIQNKSEKRFCSRAVEGGWRFWRVK